MCTFSSSALFYPALALPILHDEKSFGGGGKKSVAVSCEYLIYEHGPLVHRAESGRHASGSRH